MNIEQRVRSRVLNYLSEFQILKKGPYLLTYVQRMFHFLVESNTWWEKRTFLPIALSVNKPGLILHSLLQQNNRNRRWFDKKGSLFCLDLLSSLASNIPILYTTYWATKKAENTRLRSSISQYPARKLCY